MGWLWRLLTEKSGALVAISAACLASLAAFFCFYESSEWSFAVMGVRPLSTDQILAALAVIVTALGVVIGVVALGFALMALYGWGELKAAALKRGEEQLLKAAENLRRRGEITEGEATLLREELQQQALNAPVEPGGELDVSPAGESSWNVDSYPVAGNAGPMEGRKQNGDSGTKK